MTEATVSALDLAACADLGTLNAFLLSITGPRPPDDGFTIRHDMLVRAAGVIALIANYERDLPEPLRSAVRQVLWEGDAPRPDADGSTSVPHAPSARSIALNPEMFRALAEAATVLALTNATSLARLAVPPAPPASPAAPAPSEDGSR